MSRDYRWVIREGEDGLFCFHLEGAKGTQVEGEDKIAGVGLTLQFILNWIEKHPSCLIRHPPSRLAEYSP